MRSLMALSPLRQAWSLSKSNYRTLSLTCFIHQSSGFKCHYKELGVSKTATKQEIRNAYLQKTKKYHPDLNPNDSSMHERFVKVAEAYAVLSDEEQRNIYDGVSRPTAYTYRRRNYRHNATSTNPFGNYTESEWQWDEEMRKRMYEDLHKYYENQSVANEENAKERSRKNTLLVISVFGIALVINAVIIGIIAKSHELYTELADRKTAENAAFLRDQRTGYRSLVKKYKAEQSYQDV